MDRVSGGFHRWVRTYGLTTRFEDNHAYFRDSNIIFNKIDRFITKEITLTDDQGTQLGHWSGDVVALPVLSSGNSYTFTINYTLAVPERYHAFIRNLNAKYGIVLGQREEHILGVDQEWATRGNVYLPPTFQVETISGDLSSQRTFTTPFSQNAAYETAIHSNNMTNAITIKFRVKEALSD